MSALHTAGFRALGRTLILALVLGVAGIGAVCAQGNPPFREVLAAANGGDARAQSIAGMTYLLGQGTRQDSPAAVRWLQQSAQAGLPQALVALAGLHDVGQGVPFDANRATQLRQQAARAGNSTARSQLSCVSFFLSPESASFCFCCFLAYSCRLSPRALVFALQPGADGFFHRFVSPLRRRRGGGKGWKAAGGLAGRPRVYAEEGRRDEWDGSERW